MPDDNGDMDRDLDDVATPGLTSMVVSMSRGRMAALAKMMLSDQMAE